MKSGIYMIKNMYNNKVYIGSSSNVQHRLKRHFYYLRANRHPNKFLQNSFNKHGEDKFSTEVLELCKEEDLIRIEQSYLDNTDNTYNICTIAGKGGSEVQRIPVLLLNLDGEIVFEVESGYKAARLLGLSTLHYNRINTNRVSRDSDTREKFRVVTPDFYRDNIDVVKSWKNYTCEATKKYSTQLRYKITDYNGEVSLYRTQKKAGEHLNLTGASVSELLKRGGKHKRTGSKIEKIRVPKEVLV